MIEHTNVENLNKRSTPKKSSALFTKPQFRKMSTIFDGKRVRQTADSATTALMP